MGLTARYIGRYVSAESASNYIDAAGITSAANDIIAELGEFNNALNIFKNLETKNPNNISVMMEIAKCYEAMQDNDNALEYLDKVVDIFPEHEDAHEMIRKLS